MPKILIGVSSSYCASFLKGQVQFLVEQGFTVVIVSGPGEEISRLAKAEQTKLITIPFTKRITPFKDLGQLLKIVRILRKEKPDIINAGNPKSGFLIMLAAWLTRHKKRVFTLHGLLSDTKHGLARSIISFTEKCSCRIAHKVIVVSPSLKEHAEKRGILKAGKGIVIEKGSCNGVDLEVFTRSETVLTKGRLMRKEWGIRDEDFVIGFIGRLSKDKGVDILFKAFNIIAERYPQARLLIVGPLIEENSVPDFVIHQLYHDKRVIYTGKLYEVAPVYALLDGFVLPSLREGFPNVLLEASAMQVASVASDIPGCTDAIKEGYNGELFATGNSSILAEKLESLLLDPQKKKTYGRNGLVYVKENFNNKKIWDGMLNLYRNL